MIQFQENSRADRRMEEGREGRTKGRKERQTLFYKTLPATFLEKAMFQIGLKKFS